MSEHMIEVIGDNKVVIHRRLNLWLFCIRLESKASEYEEYSATILSTYFHKTPERYCIGEWSGSWDKAITKSLNLIHKTYSEVR